VRLAFARAENCDDLARIHARAFDASWGPAQMSALLTGPGVFALIAYHGEAAAGFILARTAAGEAEVLTLAVEPNHRRLGLGLALIGGAVGAAAKLGARSLFLEVAMDNREALGLYRKVGFAVVGGRKGYYDCGSTDAVVMRLDLNSGPASPYH